MCDHTKIVIEWTCPMDVVMDVSEGVIWDRRYVDEGETEADNTPARCRDCYADLPDDHPNVVRAREIMRDPSAEWPAGSFGY